MRLTAGNLFLLCFTTALYFMMRSYLLSTASGSGVVTGAMMQALAEASIYGSLMTLDAIIFLLPLVVALGKEHAGQPAKEVSGRVLYGSKTVFLFVALIVLLYAYYLDTIFWESCMILGSIYFFVVRTLPQNKTSFGTYLLKNNITSVSIEAINPSTTRYLPVLEVPRFLLGNAGTPSIWDFCNALGNQLLQSDHFTFDKFIVQAGTVDEFVLRHPDGRISTFILPEKCIPLMISAHLAQLFCPIARALPNGTSTACAWIPKEIFDKYYADNQFIAAKVSSLPSVVADILSLLLKPYKKKLFTTDEVFSLIHSVQLESPEALYTIELLKETGYQRVLEVSNQLIKTGLDGFDVKSVIQSVLANEDSEVESFLEYKISKNPHYLSSADGEVRVIMIRDTTFDRIENEYQETAESEGSLLFYSTADKIKEVLSTLASRDSLPYL
jgi:hypothetical protein